MVYPRKIDLEATEKLGTFEYTQLVKSVDALKLAVLERLTNLAKLSVIDE